DTIKNFVRKELPVERARKMREDDTGYSKDTWRQMGELGWLAIGMPESVGGFGGSFTEVALLLEQFGTRLVSEPYIASVVLAGHAILRAGSEEQHERFLSPMLTGDTTLALAYAERDGRFALKAERTEAQLRDGRWHLTGEKIFVLNGHAADHLVVSARTPSGLSLFVVDAKAEGLEIQRITTMDGRRAAMVRLDCQLDADRLLGVEGEAADVLDEVIDRGAAAACAEGYGILRAVLEMTIEYLQTREQFGVKIGTFQALQHRAVDMFIQTQLCQSTSMMAMIKVQDADADERRRAVSAAKVQLSTGGKFVTQQAIQLHGGIGVTDEHDVGLYFKRMHILNTLFGDEEYHVRRYGSLPGFGTGDERASA
ncbi:MAG: acyl-CoA dehydrogenase family protein, partial [Polyangiaceae bacterium]